jgi:hypothetical protein
MYIFNTLSDWEWGFIAAELNTGRFFKDQGSKVSVTTFSLALEAWFALFINRKEERFIELIRSLRH